LLTPVLALVVRLAMLVVGDMFALSKDSKQ
jgi:hypothetical protein